MDELVLNGTLDIFNNNRWIDYWKTCHVPTISIQSRLRTKGYILFMRGHVNNTTTKKLVLKRNLTLNDIFFLFYYLLKNIYISTFHLMFLEIESQSNPNLLAPNSIVGDNNDRIPQLLVTADQMELTTVIYQPLGLLANNQSLKGIYRNRNSFKAQRLHGK